MAHLIDKSALVAEIERRLEEYRTYPDYQIDSNYMELCDILSFINHLEVKEVDLNKELSYEDYKGFFEKYPNLSDDWGFEEAYTFAQYFFELGLKAQKGE